MKKVSLSQAYAGINRQFLALQAENEKLKARIKELEAQVASQQSFAPDVCPTCDGATVVLSSFGGVEDCVDCAGTGKRR
jgi:hypothetical protein